MEHYEAIGSVWFWALMIAIIALHIAAAFAKRLGGHILTAVCAVNMALHLVLAGLMLTYKAEPEELFFALLLSTVTALFTTKHGVKGEKRDDI